MSNIELSNGV